MFSIFLFLLQKRKVTSEYLAERFEISKRTVLRYMDTLISSGVPIMSLSGHSGGFVIPDDYMIDKLCFDSNELKTIIDNLSLKNPDSSDKQINSIIEKLTTLSTQSSPKNKEIFLNEDKIIIDMGAWGENNKFRKKIDSLNKAINNKTTVLIKYINRNDSFTERRFDPYNLILKQGIWYVYGWCHRRGGFRLFKLSRINDIFLTFTIFAERPGANIHEKLNEQFDNIPETDIIIEFNSLILPQIEDWLGFDAIYEEGLSYRAAATVYGGNELIAKLMSFGSSIKVISPIQIKEELLIECNRMIRVYED